MIPSGPTTVHRLPVWQLSLTGELWDEVFTSPVRLLMSRMRWALAVLATEASPPSSPSSTANYHTHSGTHISIHIHIYIHIAHPNESTSCLDMHTCSSSCAACSAS